MENWSWKGYRSMDGDKYNGKEGWRFWERIGMTIRHLWFHSYQSKVGSTFPLIANSSSRFQVTSNPHNKLYACQYTSINLSILSYLFFTFYSILLSLLFFLTFLSKSSLLYHSSSKISYTFSTNPLELSSDRRTLSKLSK